MKFTLSWLRDHLQTEASLDRITDTLTMLGLELEAVTDRAAALSAFTVARVIDAVPHPNADRLRVCQVDTGAAIHTVVCGAPNARAGMKAVFAPPGSVIPATGATLRIGEIRGVASAGMLLSAREMGLGDDHDGILDLPAEAQIGLSYPTYAGLDDPLIEIAVTPNRGDALAVRGIARDLAAAGLGTLIRWAPPAIATTPLSGAAATAWRNHWPQACPWALGRTVHGLRNGPSPPWLAARLTAVGLRPISALVDITNFLTLDLGRPLHVFDADRLRGDLTIRPGAGETFRALDGRDYTVTPADCVIADEAGVQSLGGIIGGAATACQADTTSVFIECALFDPIRVALSGRRHQILTEARARFERGVDPALLPAGLDAATAMILRLCGGTPIAGPVVAAGAEPPWRRAATLTFARLAALSGVAIPEAEAVGALERLGFTVAERDAASVTMHVPSWRNDIAAPRVLDPAPDLPPERARAAAEGCNEIEPQADLIEEILRLRGLDTIAPLCLPMPGIVPAATLTPRQSRAALSRRVLAARGLLECVTFSFTDRATAALFGPRGPIVANPIAADLDHMRPSPLPTLALAARRNAARFLPDANLFEIGPGFSSAAPDGQHRLAAGLRTGHTPRSWRDPSRPLDAFDAKADAMAVLAALGVPAESLAVTADAPAPYHPGRSGTIRQGPRLALARFGELHPAIRTALDLPPAIAFEIFLDAIPEPKRRRKPAPDLPVLQPVRRDFAFACAPDVPAEAVLRAIRGADRALITAATVFDVFALEDGRVSLGVEILLQPRERTLTDAELEAVSGRIVAAVTKATAAVLR